MSQSSIKAILLDKDGVLMDFQQTYGRATGAIISTLSGGKMIVADRLAKDVGFDIATNIIDPLSPLVAGHASDFCGIWSNVLGCTNDRAFQLLVDTLYKELTETSAVLIGGAVNMLKELAQDYHMGIATNDAEASARAQLSHVGIAGYFDFVTGYDSGHGPKPGTGMAEAFFKAMQLPCDQVVMVGDSIHDMTFARGAGMTAIGISTGPLPGAQLAGHADFVIDSLEELPAILHQLEPALATDNGNM